LCVGVVSCGGLFDVHFERFGDRSVGFLIKVFFIFGDFCCMETVKKKKRTKLFFGIGEVVKGEIGVSKYFDGKFDS